jgi:hypothetical protein
MKNSYFNIGGYEFSLFEIETCVFNKGSRNIYSEGVSFSENDIRAKFKIDDFDKVYNYGLSLPTK